ncbi:hypothetical protein LIER_10567 [Lithospermum erythrorhizon]|uniref:Uncharacterized protein n=1 Tax=Lithospermum erythrorhizon TaxID=34254 RepID=A0AAV3PNS9_LITER
MAHRLSSRLTSLLRHRATTTTLHRHITTTLHNHLPPPYTPTLRFLSTRTLRPPRPSRPDIGARARQLQTRRLWTYALTFSCIAGFIVIVINQFQDQLVFYITPSEALEKFNLNPSKSKFRLGGLVLDGSVVHIPSSPQMEFVITDLLTDMLVKYEGSLPDLFREGHSVVVEGFVRGYSDEMREKEEGVLVGSRVLEVTKKARGAGIYFDAVEVLAKHDEKYMPKEVAVALERNKKIVEKEEEERRAGQGEGGVVA